MRFGMIMQNLEKEFYEFKASIMQYINGLKEWQAQTVDYRKDICHKIDKIWEKLENLPCPERKGWYQSMGKQVSFMWSVLAIVLAALLGNVIYNHIDRAKCFADVKKEIVALETAMHAQHPDYKMP